MPLIDQFQPQQTSSEQSQSIARIAIIAVVLLYVLMAAFAGYEFNGQQQVLWLTVALSLYACALTISIRLFPGPVSWRRLVALVIDMAAVSAGFYLAGPPAVVVYPVYFWVIISNGWCFGIRYLVAATGIATAGLLSALISSEHWAGQVALSAGLIIGVITIPLFYAAVLRELQRARHDLQQQIEQTAYVATHDALTGLPNQFLFIDRLKQAIERARRNKNRFAVLYIDIDNFKHINDTFGKTIGDNLLKDIGNRLRTTLRGTDSVARFSGDEYILLLSDLMTPYNAQQAAQRITQVIFNTPFTLEGNELNVTSSIGISIYPDDAEDSDIIIKCAVSAMANARKEGGNRFESYTCIGAHIDHI